MPLSTPYRANGVESDLSPFTGGDRPQPRPA